MVCMNTDLAALIAAVHFQDVAMLIAAVHYQQSRQRTWGWGFLAAAALELVDALAMRTALPSGSGAAACDAASLATPLGITQLCDAVIKLFDFILLYAWLHCGAPVPDICYVPYLLC